tara:strand:+ start:168 stop:764 length:597 start_codon:yes stop_codon:yes gene_type:complete
MKNIKNTIFIDSFDRDVVNFFRGKLNYFRSNHLFMQKTDVMAGDVFGTVNLLKHGDRQFYSYLDRIKSKVQKHIGRSLTYYWVHMLDYETGGEMIAHNHKHSEDYTALLYLNNCNNGSTFFIIDGEKYEILPKRNRLVMYPSWVDHGSNYGTDKKVLVCGFKHASEFTYDQEKLVEGLPIDHPLQDIISNLAGERYGT